MKKVDVLGWNNPRVVMDYRYGGTYLHGELEDEVGYDIFAFTTDVTFEEGINKVIIRKTEREATFFLWSVKKSGMFPWRGFLVYDDDEDYDHCLRAFQKRKNHI